MMEPIKIQLEIIILSGGQVNIDRITTAPFCDLPQIPQTKEAEITGYRINCHHYHNKSGDKAVGSCVGCKVAGCAAKGRYKGEPMTV